MKAQIFRILYAHLLASLIAAVAGLAVASSRMGLHLPALRILMGFVFAPLLAPVSVVLVLLALLRRSAPPEHFAAMAMIYPIAFILILQLRRRTSGRPELPPRGHD